MRTVTIIAAALALSATEQARRVVYADLTPAIQKVLGDAAASEASFDAYVAEAEADAARRVAEGDRDHLIYYALQSRRFTNRDRIEPALSARRFVERLPADQRARLLADPDFLPPGTVPPNERERLRDLLGALRKPSPDRRLTYFREIVASSERSPDAFYPDYVRVARFLYQKEFVAANDAGAVAELYQTRPHSSDTQVDAGFAVFEGFGVVHALAPSFRATRVLVVGPGLDLAPRTDLIDEAEPQSYQPLAVADALLSLSMAAERDLRVHSVDINPRVVQAVQRLAEKGLTWHVFSGAVARPGRPLAPDYRDYVRRLGNAIGTAVTAPGDVAQNSHYHRSIAVHPSAANVFTAGRLNIVTERLADARFDAIVVTNVLSYFDDRAIVLALVNLAAMLRSGGYLLHNESRAAVLPLADFAGIPGVHMKSAILAGPASQPLYDVVFIHQKR